MKDLKRIKAIAKDIISDREWVNDSHSESEHKGVVNGLESLVRHLETSDDTIEKDSEQEEIETGQCNQKHAQTTALNKLLPTRRFPRARDSTLTATTT